MKKSHTSPKKILPSFSLILFFIMMTPVCSIHAQIIISIMNIDSLKCFGSCNGSITVSASGGITPYSYQWNDGQTTPTDSSLCAGTYTVTVTDSIDSSATDTFTIHDPSYPALYIHADSVNVACFGECSGQASSTVSGGVPPYSYEWFDQDGSMSYSGTMLTNLCTGFYSVMVTDSIGCSATDTTFIGEGTYINASISATPISGEAPIIIHFTYTGPNLSGNYYYWFFGDGHYSTVMNPSHLYSEADTFTVWVNVYNGNCNDYTSIQVFTYKPSSIPDESDETICPVSIFPNPVINYLNIESSLPITEIVMTDISGRIMLRTTSGIIDCSSFAKGIYLLKIKTDKGSYIKRIILGL